MRPRRRRSSLSEPRLRAAGISLATTAGLAIVAVHSPACTPSPFVNDLTDGAAGGSAGDRPTIVVETDATSPDGAGDASADGDGACAAPGTGAVAVAGCPCATSNELACAGNAQKQQLRCEGGLWVAHMTCADGMLCDSRPGSTQNCAPVASACASASPGQSVCVDLGTVGKCGPDLVSLEEAGACDAQVCSSGACTGECAPLTAAMKLTRCSGSTVETCGIDGHWGNPQTCPSACCASACSDLTTDGRNCAACGHDCLGGTCSKSLCQPVSLATGDQPSAIAVDAANVYWITSDAVLSVPLAGGNPVTLASGRSGVAAIAVDATSVYWTEAGATAGAVIKVPVGGGAATTIAQGQPSPGSLAVDATSVYWAAGSTGSGAVLKAPLGGVGDGGTPTTLASGLPMVRGLAVDATSVYFTAADGTVDSVPIGGLDAGGAPVALATGQSGVWDLAVGTASVYWATRRPCHMVDGGVACFGVVATVGLDGGVPGTLAAGQDIAGGLVAGAANVYWWAGQNLASLALDGGATTTLVSDPNSPLALAQDGVALYWPDAVCPADGGACTGAVMKVAKP